MLTVNIKLMKPVYDVYWMDDAIMLNNQDQASISITYHVAAVNVTKIT